MQEAGKVPKEEASYSNSPHGDQRCSTCTHYLPGEGACTVVAGHVEPNGWSRFYRPT